MMMRSSDRGVGPSWLDLAIVVLGVAIGILVSRAEPKELEAKLGLGTTQADHEAMRIADGRDPDMTAEMRPLARWHYRIVDVMAKVLPFVTIGAAVAIPRRRANRTRRARSRVGILTLAVTGLFVASGLANEWILRWLSLLQPGSSYSRFDGVWVDLAAATSIGVAALWVGLVIGRMWRRSEGWEDRLGRAIGMCWVALAVVGVILVFAFRP